MEKSYRVEKCDSKVQWDEFVLERAGHPLQLWGWGDLKATYGWKVDRIFVVEDDQQIAAIQLISRKLPKPFRQLVYVPRGPVMQTADKDVVYTQLTHYVKTHYRAVVLIIEPEGDNEPVGDRWRESNHHILDPSTALFDLSKPEGVLLADFSADSRDQIRDAAQVGVTVRKIGNPEDITACLALLKAASRRHGFRLHKDAYYHDLHDKMGEYSVVFGAFEHDELVGFLWQVTSETVAFSLNGAVSLRGEELHADRLLQWEAVRRFRQWGVATYDIHERTVGDADHDTDFKTARYDHAGTFDLPLSPLYSLWSRSWPRLNRIRQKLHRKPR